MRRGGGGGGDDHETEKRPVELSLRQKLTSGRIWEVYGKASSDAPGVVKFDFKFLVSIRNVSRKDWLKKGCEKVPPGASVPGFARPRAHS